ncbi:LL-diaminopimelate aminotransferase, chloroplastic [Porphyridium purpureum]|uniref:LL-diaminopimelate aminotransferase, chloroplastic n=1 Tax=Porphyridium purpureum TaxID=35688 RepID=A0A5J4YWJ9_PORPP|nr:LL-diaminopimelate aminotransferase, chloroplastic [Porphyridium purpureum]|eukprot:POR6566..scf209_3
MAGMMGFAAPGGVAVGKLRGEWVCGGSRGNVGSISTVNARCQTAARPITGPISHRRASRGAGVVNMVTGVKRNANMGKLQAGYLFPEIAKRRNAFQAANPDAKIISLGIGDTTQPVPPHIAAGLKRGAEMLATDSGYSGYGPSEGVMPLREKIASKLYEGIVKPEEVYVSDGAKCDIARLQFMFGYDVTVAVQDPSYPVYVDTSVIQGQTGTYNGSNSQFDGIVYMQCLPENDFFPDLSKLQRTDVIFFCAPNNPTGAVATRSQLKELVDFALKNGSIIIYDAAYAPFVKNSDVPRSIFEIPGARECAIECNSFSKYAGFTGVRLGWTVVPGELKFADGTPVAKDYGRIMNTCFNGASNVVQEGGLACLDDEGLKEIDALIEYYMGNAALLRETFLDLGYKVYGGTDAPYVWVHFPGRDSWDVFNEIMEKTAVVTIPGAGFGPSGTEFLRLSAFAPRDACVEATERIRKALAK